jgi:hypothetical protein
MTIFKNNLNEQLFSEISSKEAEVIQGGYNFTGYRYKKEEGGDNREVIAQADFALPELKFDNQMDYVNIESGTWRLYSGSNYSGKYKDFGKGYHKLGDYYFPRVAQTGEPAIPVGNNVSSLKKL